MNSWPDLMEFDEVYVQVLGKEEVHSSSEVLSIILN